MRGATRKFNGKTYHFHHSYDLKSRANAVADVKRDKGASVRVLTVRNKGRNEYWVYVRGGGFF